MRLLEMIRKPSRQSDPGRRILKLAAVICAALGWWGFLYPELTLTSDTYRVVWEEEEQTAGRGVPAGAANQEADERKEGYRELLQADSCRIKVRSRLYLTIKDWLDAREETEVINE
ncbi:MAG: hypothetical protein NC081_04345 [Roseburia sp.]|nr:hypothetical protein [Roseburia sp.]